MVNVLKILFLFTLISFGNCAVQFVKNLLQVNVFGVPVLHKTVNWNFDPDEGVRRSRQYQELNGIHGEKAIERLGLGVDGYDQQRLARQRERDIGHLGGLDALRP